MNTKQTVERTTRTVIEHKLLTALEDGNTVAVLLSKQDLQDMIGALYRVWPTGCNPGSVGRVSKTLRWIG